MSRGGAYALKWPTTSWAIFLETESTIPMPQVIGYKNKCTQLAEKRP